MGVHFVIFSPQLPIEDFNPLNYSSNLHAHLKHVFTNTTPSTTISTPTNVTPRPVLKNSVARASDDSVKSLAKSTSGVSKPTVSFASSTVTDDGESRAIFAAKGRQTKAAKSKLAMYVDIPVWIKHSYI